MRFSQWLPSLPALPPTEGPSSASDSLKRAVLYECTTKPTYIRSRTLKMHAQSGGLVVQSQDECLPALKTTKTPEARRLCWNSAKQSNRHRTKSCTYNTRTDPSSFGWRMTLSKTQYADISSPLSPLNLVISCPARNWAAGARIASSIETGPSHRFRFQRRECGSS